MKLSIIAAVVFCSVFSITNALGQTKAIPAEVVLKDALDKAASVHKNVFVIFHASWCGWCHKMDSSMNDGKLQSFFNNNYVVVHLTVDESKDKKELENPGASELRKKYNGDQQGLPYWFILDARGNFLADSRLKPANAAADAKATSVGCPASPEEVDYFAAVLKKTSSLNDEQVALVKERFLKNKE